MHLKLFYFLPLLLVFFGSSGFCIKFIGKSEYFLQNLKTLHLILQFGEDHVKDTLTRTITTPTLDDATITFYGDEINLSDPQVKVSRSGDHFRISSIPDGIIMYGHYNENSKLDIDIYFAGQNGLIKYPVSTSYQPAQLEIIEPTNTVVSKTNVDLHILTDQYERVYNKSNYKFFVKTFDDSIYTGSNFDEFQGKVSGAKVSAIIIDPNGDVKSDVSGFVEHGIYERSVYVPENLWQRGWYTVDVVVEFEGKFYQEQLSFYVYGHPPPDDGCNAPC